MNIFEVKISRIDVQYRARRWPIRLPARASKVCKTLNDLFPYPKIDLCGIDTKWTFFVKADGRLEAIQKCKKYLADTGVKKLSKWMVWDIRERVVLE